MSWGGWVLSCLLALLPGGALAVAQRSYVNAQGIAVTHTVVQRKREATPRLYFLLLARDNLPNEEVWKRFFAPARQGVDYQVFVHCTNEAKCEKNIQDKKMFQLIPTMPSKWCQDLVSPMNSLLVHALSSDHGMSKGHPSDKFIFISESTVPVKPWRHVQHMLGEMDGTNSSFCIRPWWTWAWHDADVVAVKHDQWFILSREHVNKALSYTEGPVVMHHRLTPLHWARVEWLARGLYNINKMVLQRIFSPSSIAWLMTSPPPSGCIDEYWHFASIFGYLDRELGSTGLNIPGLSNGRIVMDEDNARETQGRCDTYVRFNHEVQIPELTEALEDSEGTTWERATSWRHPGRFEQLSQDSLGILRESPFLFARKVDSETTFAGGISLPDAFDQFVFNAM